MGLSWSGPIDRTDGDGCTMEGVEDAFEPRLLRQVGLRITDRRYVDHAAVARAESAGADLAIGAENEGGGGGDVDVPGVSRSRVTGKGVRAD